MNERFGNNDSSLKLEALSWVYMILERKQMILKLNKTGQDQPCELQS